MANLTPLKWYCASLVLLCVVYLLLPWEIHTALGRHILFNIKLPVLLTAIIVGFGICSASAVLQVLLKNPLADPGILGIASGASAMAAVYFLLINGLGLGATLLLSPLALSLLLPLMCFVGALFSGVLIFKLSKKIGFNPATVILSGIAISTLLAAAVAWLYLILPPTQLQNLTFWLMGALNNANWYSLTVAVLIITACAYIMFLHNERLNWLFFGEQVAQIKGLNTYRFQRILLILIALMVGTSVSIAGSIAFIGLIIPHMLRRIHGHDNRLIVPAAGVSGACILLMCAIVNEHFAVSPLPISLLTASIGAPIFIWLLAKGSSLRPWRNSA